MTVEFIQACAMWAKAFDAACGDVEDGLWEDGDKHIQTYIIRFPKSGRRIEALTSRPSNMRGRQGRVVMDEFAFHDDQTELLKAAIALLIWGGCVRVISTHDGEDNPFNELIKEVRSGKRAGTVHRTTFNEAVEQGLYKRVCLRKKIKYDPAEEQEWVKGIYKFYGDASDEELDVIPSKGGGRWLALSLLESKKDDAVPVIRFEAPKGWDNFDQVSEETRNAEVHEFFNERLKPLLEALQQDAFFQLSFPKTTGPEVFNLAYLAQAQQLSGTSNLSHADIMATLNCFSAQMIIRAIEQTTKTLDKFVIYASGGGMHNPLLMSHIQQALPEVSIKTTADLAINPDAKEAVLFAVLANECVAGGKQKFSNAREGIPGVTMGKISFAD